MDLVSESGMLITATPRVCTAAQGTQCSIALLQNQHKLSLFAVHSVPERVASFSKGKSAVLSSPSLVTAAEALLSCSAIGRVGAAPLLGG